MFKIFIVFGILNFSIADDTVTWDCAAGDTSCDIQRDDPNRINCGKYQKYNPKTARTQPETKGVIGGYDYDGTPNYIGYAPSYCNNPAEIPSCPGAIYTVKRKIQVETCWMDDNLPEGYDCGYVLDEVSAGIHMLCGKEVNLLTDTVYFLLNHKDFNWVDTNITHMLTINALKLPGFYYNFIFGRIWFKGNWRFGKVHIDKKQNLGIYFHDEDFTILNFQDGFQVLTSSECKNGGVGQFCCKNGANNPDCCPNGGYGNKCTLPCGHQLLLSEMNNPDNPETPGFASGTYEDGSTVYPGNGFFPEINLVDVARIQTSTHRDGPGAYIGWGRYYFHDNTRPKYFLAHPNLKWVRTNGTYANYVPGAIKNFFRFGELSSYDYYARVNFTTERGFYTNIGYVWRGEVVCVWNGTREYCNYIDFDILVCSP